MKFFIPYAKDKKQEKSVYESTKKFLLGGACNNILDTKIYKIFFKHDGKEYLAVVGEITDFNNEHVIAIFESDAFYMVCTPNRGVLRDLPIYVGKNFDTSVKIFDKN